MACDMPEPCKFLSFGSCHNTLLRIQKEVHLAPHQVAGLVLKVGDTEKFPHALGFERLDPFSSESLCKNEENGRTNRPKTVKAFISADLPLHVATHPL